MAAPTKKPAKLKAIAGTQRPDREAEPGISFEPLTEIPDPPDWLPNVHALHMWDRCAPMLVANGLLTQMNEPMLGVLCAMHGRIVQKYAAGEEPTGHAVAQYSRMLTHFGIPVDSWAKIRPSDIKTSNNKFDRARQA